MKRGCNNCAGAGTDRKDSRSPGIPRGRGEPVIPYVLCSETRFENIIQIYIAWDERSLATEKYFENCSIARDAGVNVLVSGSTIFNENQGDLKKNIEILRTN